MCSCCFVEPPLGERKLCFMCLAQNRVKHKMKQRRKREAKARALAVKVDVDVAFSENVSNLFAVRIGHTAFVVRAGRVEEVVRVDKLGAKLSVFERPCLVANG